MRRALLASVGFGLLSGCISGAYTAAKPTALERQILGAYEELDDKLVHAASVRAAKGALETLGFERLEAEAVQARSLQRFNEDDLSELTAAGCLAEGLGARVVARPCSLGDTDPAAPRRIVRVVDEENAARDTILRWAAHTLAREQGRPAPSAAELAELRDAYQRLLREAALPGHLVEVRPGDFQPVSR